MNPTDTDPVDDRDTDQPVPRVNLRQSEENGWRNPGSVSGSGFSGGSGYSGSGASFNFNPNGDKKKNDNAGSSSATNNDNGFRVSGDSVGGGGGSTGTTGASSGLLSKELAGATGVAGAATTLAAGAKNMFWGTTNRKRATIGGGIIGTLVGGSIFVFIILAGPGQLVQLSQMLQKNFNGINNSSSIRANKLLGSAGAQDIGETRVGVIQRQYLRSAITNLSEVGIDLNANSTGGFKSADIDTKKLANKYSELHDMSTDDQKSWLAEELGINPDKISITSDSTFHIDGLDLSTSNIRAFLGSSTDLALDGGVLGAVNKRTLITYFNVPSLFHPFSRALEAKLRNTTNMAEREKELEEDRQQTDLEPTEAIADENVSDVESASSTYNSAAANALLYTGGVCFVRSTANDVVKINRYRILLPAAITAIQFIAIGSQIQSGQNVSADEVGAAAASLTSVAGSTVWQGQALQVLEGDSNPSGPDISPGYKQAFSPNTTAASIESAADKSLGGNGIAGAACSTPGQLAQVAISIFQGLGSAFAEAASDGAATPLVVGSWAARFGEDAAVQLVTMHFLQSFVLNKSTEGKLADDAFSGASGGNLLAYGAREAANIGSIAEGAVPLSNSNSVSLANEQQQQDNQQFRSESFAARMFNIDDSRSLAGKLADSIRPSFSQNITDAATNFGSLGSSLLSNLSSIFTPKSHADSNYDWGFPVAAIPDKLMNDPAYADIPGYQAKAAALFSSTAGQQYIDKSMTCFGNQISDDGGVWDITHKQNPDTSDPSYTSAGCGDLSDPNWNMTIMFNFDTWTADGMACTGWNDEQACQAIGFGQSSSTGSSGTTTSTPTSSAGATIDMSQLYDSSVNVACAQGTNDIGVYDGYSSGNKVKIRLCAIPGLPSSGEEANNGYGVTGANGNCPLNSRVSGAVYAMVQAAKQDGVNLTTDSCFRTMAHQQALWQQDGENTAVVAAPGTSNHQMGLAMDFSVPMCDTTINGQCSDPGNAMWNWVNKNAGNFGYKSAVASEAWHWSPTGN